VPPSASNPSSAGARQRQRAGRADTWLSVSAACAFSARTEQFCCSHARPAGHECGQGSFPGPSACRSSCRAATQICGGFRRDGRRDCAGRRCHRQRRELLRSSAGSRRAVICGGCGDTLLDAMLARASRPHRSDEFRKQVWCRWSRSPMMPPQRLLRPTRAANATAGYAQFLRHHPLQPQHNYALWCRTGSDPAPDARECAEQGPR